MNNLLDSLAQEIRAQFPGKVPNFDENGGTETSEILFLLEAPGPIAALEKGSKKVSLDTNDGSARRLKMQVEDSGLQQSDIVIWNIVPWYLGDGKSIDTAKVTDIAKARPFLEKLLGILTKLRFVVLVGEKARKEFVYLSGLGKFEVLGMHHTSNQAFRKDREEKFTTENRAVLDRLARALKRA